MNVMKSISAAMVSVIDVVHIDLESLNNVISKCMYFSEFFIGDILYTYTYMMLDI